jgi:oligopeptide transport system permease protein
MSVETISPDALSPPLPADIVGDRSLWIDARNRLLRNKAAVASVVFLVLMTLACVFGPYFVPQTYNDTFDDYTKVPASLQPYPRAEDIQPALEQALRRARVSLATYDIADNRVRVGVTSTRDIDPRIGLYLDRSDLFANAVLVTMAEDKRSATLEADIVHETFLFGTDTNGRSLLARVFVGGRVSLTIGVLAALIALFAGVTYGAVAGFFGGRLDMLMMRIVDILYSLPYIFFVILFIVFFGRNFLLMLIAVGCLEWLDMSRIVRGQTLTIKTREYVEAAHALGVRGGSILRRHIVPNLLGPVVVYVTLIVPKVILFESLISFLGLGVQDPMTSWGVLISEGAHNIQGAPWLLVFPTLFLVSTLFALNFLGDGLRDALDPKDR